MTDDLISREAALAAIPNGWTGEPHQSNMDYGPTTAVKAVSAIRALPAAQAQVPDGLIEALRSGEQADADGCRVKVSRQACEEAASILAALPAALASREATPAEVESAEVTALRARVTELEALVQSADSIMENCAVESGVCCCGDNMEGHAEPMLCGHTPVDMGDWAAVNWRKEARAALAKLGGG